MHSFCLFGKLPLFLIIFNLEFPFHFHLLFTLRNLDLNTVSTVTNPKLVIALGIEFSSVYTIPLTLSSQHGLLAPSFAHGDQGQCLPAHPAWQTLLVSQKSMVPHRG